MARERETGVETRWLLHPVTLVALLVLAVNDHVAKQRWPGLVTGKVSDAAGLVAAPAVLALLLGPLARRTRVRPHLPALATALTGLGFAAVKLDPDAAHLLSVVLGRLVPSRVLADPTDLAALPALGVALVAARSRERCVERRTPRAGLALRRAGVIGVLPLAVGTLAATAARQQDEVVGLGLVTGDFVPEGEGGPPPTSSVLVVTLASAEGGGGLWSLNPAGPWHPMRDRDIRTVGFVDQESNLVADGCSASGRVCWRWGYSGDIGTVVQRADGPRGPWRTVWPDQPWATRTSATSAPAGGSTGLVQAFWAGVVLPSGDLATDLDGGLLVLHPDGTSVSTPVSDLLRQARAEPSPLFAGAGGKGGVCSPGMTEIRTVEGSDPCLGHFVVAPRVAPDQRPRPRQVAPPSGSSTAGPARPGSRSGSR